MNAIIALPRRAAASSRHAGLRPGAGLRPSAEHQPGAGFRVSLPDAEGRLYVVELGAGEHVLGCGPAADLLVPDAPADETLLLRCDDPPGSGAMVAVALTDGLRLRDRILRVGVPAPLGDRATVTAGALTLQFESQTQAAGPRWFVPAALLGGSAVLALWALAGVPGLPSPPPAVAGLRGALPETAETLAADLTARLAQHNLGATATVRDGTVRVAGATGPDEARRVRGLADAAARRSRVPVITAVTTETDPAAAQVSAVALAPRAYVTWRDGRRFRPGDRLPDGSVLSAIGESGLTLSRDGAETRVRF